MSERYLSIARELQQDIENKVYAVGEPLPGRWDLAKRFHVTRATLDRSIQVLLQKKLVSTRRGAGTYVRQTEGTYLIGVVANHLGSLYQALIPPHFKLEEVPPDTLAARSDRIKLNRFDGVVWMMPSDRELDWLRETQQHVSQIVVNRELPGINFVSTDHRRAVYDLTAKRLRQYPEAVPVFLNPASRMHVMARREAGFLDACREAGRFYENVWMPEPFDEKLACLEKQLAPLLPTPLLIVSSVIHHSGSVAAWVRQHGLTWKKDVLYSDFDNDLPLHIFGVKMTSFIQDYQRMATLALDKLSHVIRGRESAVALLLPPTCIHGDT